MVLHGGLSSALQWWDESQLRVLVLGSMAIQLLLFVAASLRKLAIPACLRFFTWLLYLGSDAVAIYALATLFNRHSREQRPGSALEALWAPVLLMHLGGQSTIAAYNIEDNELWGRHVVTAVTQVAVAAYIFLKSWPAGGDKLLLAAAVLCFVPGTLKCIGKPIILHRASVNGLASCSAPRRVSTGSRAIDVEHFVRQARATFVHDAIVADRHDPTPAPGVGGGDDNISVAVRREPRKLVLDLLSPYPDRLSLLKHFRELGGDKAYDMVRIGLSNTFDLLYTKRRTELLDEKVELIEAERAYPAYFSKKAKRAHRTLILANIQLFGNNVLSLLIALGLFHKSQKEGYPGDDIKVTYTLFCCTVVLGLCVFVSDSLQDLFASTPKLQGLIKWPEDVAQYNLIRFFINRHSKWAWLFLKPLTYGWFRMVLECIEPFLQPLFGMECSCGPSSSCCGPSSSAARRIIRLVFKHLENGWREHIHDASTYRMFNDQRGQRTLRLNGCQEDLEWSLRLPLDESVLLWHIATDLCFYQVQVGADDPDHHHQDGCAGRAQGCAAAAASCPRYPHHERAAQCREMSNYMVHLLYVNPEMLMVGARQNLFEAAFQELDLFHKNDKLPMDARGLVQKLTAKVKPSTQDSQAVAEEQEKGQGEGFIRDAYVLADALLGLGDENKMWEVIEGVWVEMLCFSAGTCRGYLHAKALGKGGELLTYVWLLRSYMGMETLAERLQRAEFPSGGGGGASAVAASTSQEGVHTATGEENV